MRPPLSINSSQENGLTGIIGAYPSKPPNSTFSPTSFPITGIIRTAVVFWLIIPIAISSAIIPYINRDAFWSPQTLDYFSFTTWDENYRTAYSLRDLQKRVKENFQENQNLYLIYTYDFNEETMKFLEEQGYLVNIFESNESVNEEYRIYKIEPKFLLAESI